MTNCQAATQILFSFFWIQNLQYDFCFPGVCAALIHALGAIHHSRMSLAIKFSRGGVTCAHMVNDMYGCSIITHYSNMCLAFVPSQGPETLNDSQHFQVIDRMFSFRIGPFFPVDTPANSVSHARRWLFYVWVVDRLLHSMHLLHF